MKRSLIVIFIFLILGTGAARAETMYVGEIIEITLRTGPGIDHKVIAMVSSGTTVDVLELGPEWTKVRLPNEKEGYMLRRFLTNKKPKELILEELKNRYRSLEEKTESLRVVNRKQNEEIKNLMTELQSKEELLGRVTDSYEVLRKDSGDFLNLKSNHQKIAKDLTEQTKKAETMEKALIRLQKRQIFIWVFTGAGILLVGFLIGISSRRQRRRPSLL